MKKLAYIALAAVVSACGSTSEQAETAETDEVIVEEITEPVMAYFGEEINAEGAIDAAEVLAKLGDQDSIPLKVQGTIEKVCQVKGCWMTMHTGEDETMLVKFKDYGFFVPKNIDGKETIIDGIAKVERYSVDELKHLAEDEGQSEEEIAAITEPEVKLSFEANGVLVKDYAVEANSAEADEQNVEEGHEGHDHSDHSDHEH